MSEKNPVPVDDVVDIDLDAAPTRERTKLPAATVRIGGQTFEVAPPDAGLVMEIEEAGTTARILALLFDDQWPDVRPLLEGKDPEDLLTLVNTLGNRFGFSQNAMMARATPNRAARRQRPAPAR